MGPFSDLQKHCECETCSFGRGAAALLVLTGSSPVSPRICAGAKIRSVIPCITTGFCFGDTQNDSSPVIFVWIACGADTGLTPRRMRGWGRKCVVFVVVVRDGQVPRCPSHQAVAT